MEEGPREPGTDAASVPPDGATRAAAPTSSPDWAALPTNENPMTPGGMSDQTATRWGGEESVRARQSEHAGSVAAVTSTGEPAGLDLAQAGEDGTRSGVLVDRDVRFERQDHLASVGRMRRLLPIAIALWIGFFVVDVVFATWVAPGPLLPYIVLRAVGTVPIVGAWALLGLVDKPSPRMLLVADVLMTASCAGVLSAMCLYSGGLASPYNSYIPLVLVGRAAVLPNRWQEGAWRLGVPALVNPLILGLAAIWSTAMASQWGSGAARGHYLFYLMLIGGAWLLLVIGGHNVWALRRQVFSSRSIGRYRLRRRVGHGGMGEVWVAFHDQLKRNVALKILRPEPGAEASTAVARFEREVAATAELSHPNTVRIYDHGVTDDGLQYYAMELLHGVDLDALVRSVGPLPASRAIYLIRQAARALAEAHAHAIIHRDIKPANIFVTTLGGEPDFIKVLDFGIAKLEREDGAKLTTTGFVAGTPAYLPPEAVIGGNSDARADVYGLGGVLYYALTATTPFGADNAREMFQQHLNAPLQPPSSRRGERLPADLEAVVMRCMAKKPGDRYRHAGELVEALDACADAHAWQPIADTLAREPIAAPVRKTAPYMVESAD